MEKPLYEDDGGHSFMPRLGGFLRTLKLRRESDEASEQYQVAHDETDRSSRKDRPAEIKLSDWRLDLITKGDPPPQAFLLAPLFPLGTAGVLFGPGGVGKSMVALDLAISLVRRAIRPGGDLNFVAGPLGCTIPPEAGGSSIFISLEDSLAELHRRTVALDPQNTRKDAPVFVIPGVELPDFDPILIEERGRVGVLTDFAERGLPKLLDQVADASDYPPTLLALDPAGDFLSGEESSASVVKPLMRRLREVARQYNCTIILIGHVAKTLDPAELTMRGSGAWIANSRFAYSLSPQQQIRGGKKDDASNGPPGLIWGQLTKANHSGAPIGKRRPFLRDATTGRLVDASGVAMQEPTEDDLLAALVLACIEAAQVQRPFSVSGQNGLYDRRGELPASLNGISKNRLTALGNLAISQGRLMKGDRGSLIATDE